MKGLVLLSTQSVVSTTSTFLKIEACIVNLQGFCFGIPKCGHIVGTVYLLQHNSFTGHSFYIKVPNQPVKTSALVWRKCRAKPAFQSHFTLSRACSVSTEIRTLTLCCCVASTQKTVGHNNQEIILVSSKHVLFAFYVFVNV